jgi:hypothetical protein
MKDHDDQTSISNFFNVTSVEYGLRVEKVLDMAAIPLME